MSVDVVTALVPTARRHGTALYLVRGPYLIENGTRHELPGNAGSVLSLLALGSGSLGRRATAGRLWPVGDEHRAAGNLRSALWRLREAGIDLVEGDRTTMRLRREAVVDVRLAAAWAIRLVEGHPTSGDLSRTDWQRHAVDLLPGRFDDWVVLERERLRQRMLHGLEAMGRILVRVGRMSDAVAAGRAAVGMDPLRESGQMVLVEALLAAGDHAGARHAVHRYRTLLDRELGVRPRPALSGMVGE